MKNNSGTILIIEDDENLGKTLNEFLKSIGYDCYLAQDGKQARTIFNSKTPKIVLMDIGLPDISGLDLAREFRTKRLDFVLLFLSALNDPETRVEGLEIGAEDYITKPFAIKELTLRLERILKSNEEDKNDPEEIIIGDLKIWFKRYQVQKADGILQNLSQKECGILKYLYDNKNNVVTRDELISNLWGENKFPTNRTVDNYMVILRKWSETSINRHLEIQSVRGIGYKLIIR